MTCEALRASNFSWTMECWATATGGIRLTTTNTRAPMPVEDEPTGNDLDDAIRDYVRTPCPVARPPQDYGEIRGLPPHPMALPGAGALGEITAQGGDQGRWRRPRRDRSGGLGHNRQPPYPAPRRRQSPTPGRDPGGHPAAAVRRAPGHC